MSALSLLFGAIVGLLLGLTGGGGSVFAIPLLVYGLHVPAREAIGISLAAVGATALVGFLRQWRSGRVETGTGLLFAAAGMLGAPVGVWLAGMLPEQLLLLLFAVLMVAIAIRMWRQASRTAQVDEGDLSIEQGDGTRCQRDESGALALNSRCAVVLFGLGVATGVLSGLFGVGGGIIIVPALVIVSKMPIHRAVGTSLLVISLVSAAGLVSHLIAGRPISPSLAGLFIVGGVGGMLVGQSLGHRLAGPLLQRVFVVVILVVATLIVLKNIYA